MASAAPLLIGNATRLRNEANLQTLERQVVRALLFTGSIYRYTELAPSIPPPTITETVHGASGPGTGMPESSGGGVLARQHSGLSPIINHFKSKGPDFRRKHEDVDARQALGLALGINEKTPSWASEVLLCHLTSLPCGTLLLKKNTFIEYCAPHFLTKEFIKNQAHFIEFGKTFKISISLETPQFIQIESEHGMAPRTTYSCLPIYAGLIPEQAINDERMADVYKKYFNLLPILNMHPSNGSSNGGVKKNISYLSLDRYDPADISRMNMASLYVNRDRISDQVTQFYHAPSGAGAAHNYARIYYTMGSTPVVVPCHNHIHAMIRIIAAYRSKHIKEGSSIEDAFKDEDMFEIVKNEWHATATATLRNTYDELCVVISACEVSSDHVTVKISKSIILPETIPFLNTIQTEMAKGQPRDLAEVAKICPFLGSNIYEDRVELHWAAGSNIKNIFCELMWLLRPDLRAQLSSLPLDKRLLIPNVDYIKETLDPSIWEQLFAINGQLKHNIAVSASEGKLLDLEKRLAPYMAIPPGPKAPDSIQSVPLESIPTISEIQDCAFQGISLSMMGDHSPSPVSLADKLSNALVTELTDGYTEEGPIRTIGMDRVLGSEQVYAFVDSDENPIGLTDITPSEFSMLTISDQINYIHGAPKHVADPALGYPGLTFYDRNDFMPLIHTMVSMAAPFSGAAAAATAGAGAGAPPPLLGLHGGRHPSKKSKRSKRNGTNHKQITMGHVLSRKLRRSHRKPAAKSRRYTQRRKSNK